MEVGFFTIESVSDLFDGLLESCLDVFESVSDLFTLVTGTFLVTVPIFVLVLAATIFGRRLLPKWACYLLWTIVLVRLVLPFSVTSPISAQILWSVVNVDGLLKSESLHDRLLSIVAIPEPQDPNSPSADVDSATSHSSSVLLENLLLSLWTLLLGGSIVFAFGTLAGFYQMIARMRNGNECSDQRCGDLAEEGRRVFGIRARVRLRTVHELGCPATFDWFLPTILLPEYFTSLSEAERRHVVWHELARIRRGDSGMSLLLACIGIFHWWNPLFWWARRCWLIERELACDNLAISRLSSQHAADYDLTLRRLQQKHSTRSRVFHLCNVPGVVTFLDSNAILQQRLRNLTNKIAGKNGNTLKRDDVSLARDATALFHQSTEGRLTFFLSSCVVATFAVAGLTDAAKPAAEERPIELPAGTTWAVPEVIHPTEEAEETRTYDLSSCIEGIRKHDVGETEEQIAESIRRQVDRTLRPTVAIETSNGPGPGNASTVSKESKCELHEHALSVRATSNQHDVIARLLSGWADHGHRHICIEVRTIWTSIQLAQLLPKGGGCVTNSKSIVQWNGSPQNILQIPISSVSASRDIQSPLPVFTQALTDAEMHYFWQRGLAYRCCSCCFAPKVTVLEGHTANVNIGSTHQFTTGYLTLKTGTLEPHATTVLEGNRLNILAMTESDKVRLSVAFCQSEVLEVQELKLRSGSQDLVIQIPKLCESLIESTSVLSDGQTLVVVPLRRNSDGKLAMTWITPRIIDPEEEEGLLGLPRYPD